MFQSFRSSHSEVLLGKGVLKICSKFTGEHPCRSAISIKLLCNFIEITLRHGRSPVNLLHIFRTLFSKNTNGRLLLKLTRVCIPKPSLKYKCSLVCDVIDFICDLKLFKAVHRNYFYVADNLITIPRSINYGKSKFQ